MVSQAFTEGEIAVRTAVFEDAPAIAKLHVEVWRETYRGLATQAAWEALTPEVRLARWREVLAEDHPRRFTLVAERDGRLLGFGTACAPSEAAFEGSGEIRWLHVAPEAKRMGLGRALMAALAGKLGEWGYQGCALGVVVGNAPAMAFYDALGGRRAGGYVDPGPLWRSQNVVFVWDSLADLVGAAQAAEKNRSL